MTGIRRGPLCLIALPAPVAVWAGWVGLGQLAGFGLVHPLPRIASGFQLNTVITLPVGVEAYGAFALSAWLAPSAVPERARRFARAVGDRLAGARHERAGGLPPADCRARAPCAMADDDAGRLLRSEPSRRAPHLRPPPSRMRPYPSRLPN